MRYLLHLIWRHHRQEPGRALAAWAVLTLAATLMLALSGAGAALQFRLGGYLQQLFPSEQIRLEPAQATLGLIALQTTALDEALLGRLRSQPDVEAVWPVQTLRFPVMAAGNLFKQAFSTDVVIQGVPAELAADALPDPALWADPAGGAPIPAVLPTFWVDLFNLGYARAYGLPQLNPASVAGKHFSLIPGASILLSTAGGEPEAVYRCRIVGFTHNPAIQGVALPAAAVERLNAAHAGGRATNIAQAVVQLAPGANREALILLAGQWGLKVAPGDFLGERLKSGVRLAGMAVMSLAAGVFALGILMFYLMFTLMFHARRLDLMRMRALGMEPARLVALAVGEVGVVALPAVATAGALVYFGARALAGRAGPLLETIEVLPTGLLEPSVWPLALCAAAILVLSLAPATPALRWALKTEPGEVLRDL